MIVNINEIPISQIDPIIEDYDRKGGSFRFNFYSINENYKGKLPESKFNAHLSVARQSLEKITYQTNFGWNRVEGKGKRMNYPQWQTNHKELEDSGIKITLEEFLGPHWNYEYHKPIIHSKDSDDSKLTYQTSGGTVKYSDSDIEIARRRYFEIYNNGGAGFISGLINPAYSLNIDKKTAIFGKYVDQIIDCAFNDVTKLDVFKWSCNCHPIFDAGKEWWGTYFFTVFNPSKNWYIGLIASETD